MIARILCAGLVLCLTLGNTLFSQNANCPKIRVGVNIEEVYTEVFDHLNKEYSTDKHRAIWLAELGEKLMENLRNNSPEIEFIYLPANPGADYDYLFKTLIALIGGGANIEVVPEQTIIEGDNVLTVPPVYRSEYIDYLVLSSLIVNSNCYPSRRYILKIEKYQNSDVNLAIAGNVVQFWRLINILETRENERPVPPRNPTVEIRLEKEFLSPLFEETRKMKIYEKVISCNGVPAYFTHDHSQPVKFPEKMERGDIEPADNCKCYNSGGGIQYILVNQAGDAVGEYTLKRGLSPHLEKMTLTTCPLGNKPVIERDIEIIIRGLELLVEPYKRVIKSGERTRIAIDLHEIDPEGFKYPAVRQEVEIKVSGLVDGTISPTDKVTVDDMGVAWIDYKAGQNDKQIKITATFTPSGYVETVTGEATIKVLGIEGYSGTITIIKSWDYTEDFSGGSIKYAGTQTVSFNGTFKPIPQMEGMEGQPITIYGPHKVTGTWSHNEDRYCSGDCSCSGLNYQEFGGGEFPTESLQGLILITNLFPTDNKVVADQLGQFGLTSWYDIATPTENVPTKTRTKSYTKDLGCQWHNSTSTTNLTGSDARFKIKDINNLEGSVSWSSSKGTTGVSITDMTEAIYDQKPFDPEKDGADYRYTIRWSLKAL